jgi:hypothetical protein
MKSSLTFGIIGCAMLTAIISSIPNALAIDYGANRDRRTCPSRLAPTKGAISAAQAKVYVACSYEERPAGLAASIYFVDILSIQVAPKSRKAQGTEISIFQIDIDRPVYDLKGSIVVYSCIKIKETGGIYPRGKNCLVNRVQDSRGICYQTTFAEWKCSMSGRWRPEKERVAAPS